MKTTNGAPLDGVDLSVMFSSAAASLERELPTLNRLNVFPVPDADTGSNMVHTVLRATEELGRLHDSGERNVGQVVAHFARGAFAGARGNSGVILAEFIRGLSQPLAHSALLDGPALVRAFSSAATQVYKSVEVPVEGTMLTVIRDVAEACAALPPSEMRFVGRVLDHAVQTARLSVSRTPDLLPMLKEHGVVDSGALGIAVFLEGMRRGMGGSMPQARVPAPRDVSLTPAGAAEEGYGFCTEFVITDLTRPEAEVRSAFRELGKSLVIAGGDHRIRVHLHTNDPGAALSRAITLGTLHDISVRNMDDQHDAAVPPAAPDAVSEPHAAASAELTLAAGEPRIVALVPGSGFAAILESLGARVCSVVSEARSIISALLGEGAQVVVVSCDESVRTALEEIRAGEKRRIHLLRCNDAPSCVAALMAYTFDAPVDQNMELMRAAAEHVTVVDCGDESELEAAVSRAVSEGRVPGAGLATLYYGVEVNQEHAERAARAVGETLGIECEAIYGGQETPAFQIAIE